MRLASQAKARLEDEDYMRELCVRSAQLQSALQAEADYKLDG